MPKNPFKIDLCNKKQENIAFKMLHFNIFVESCGKNDLYILKYDISADITSLSLLTFSDLFNFYALEATWGLLGVLGRTLC